MTTLQIIMLYWAITWFGGVSFVYNKLGRVTFFDLVITAVVAPIALPFSAVVGSVIAFQQITKRKNP